VPTFPPYHHITNEEFLYDKNSDTFLIKRETLEHMGENTDLDIKCMQRLIDVIETTHPKKGSVDIEISHRVG